MDSGPGGDVFFAEQGCNTIHRISDASDDVATVIAGTGDPGCADGPGIEATFNSPMGIAVDGAGMLVVTEAHKSSVRLIAPTEDRTVTTVPLSFEHGRFVSSKFNPRLCAVDYSGGLVVADKGNHTIWRIDDIGLVPPTLPVTWALREHRQLAQDWGRLGAFVTTVLLCAHRIDKVHTVSDSEANMPPLPFEMWATILTFLTAGEMHSKL